MAAAILLPLPAASRTAQGRNAAAIHLPPNFYILHKSRTISRVLSLSEDRGHHSSRSTVTRTLKQPTRKAWPGQPPFLFGLAPDEVYLACLVAKTSGGLLPHRFTLTANAAVCFLLHLLRVAPPGGYPASCPVEPGLSSPRILQRWPVQLLCGIYFSVKSDIWLVISAMFQPPAGQHKIPAVPARS